MYKIGDKIKEKGMGRVLEIINILDDTLILKECNVNELNVITFNESQVVPYVEVEKTNKIKRINGAGKESIIKYDINDKDIIFSIEDYQVNLASVLKLLLHETELYNYKYERISPFKINKSYDDGHIFTLEFLDVKTYEVNEKELIKTDKNMAIKGNFKLFIPDFLELCVNLGIVQRLCNGYILIKKLNTAMCGCSYIKDKPSLQELNEKGFVIPEKYKNI